MWRLFQLQFGMPKYPSNYFTLSWIHSDDGTIFENLLPEIFCLNLSDSGWLRVIKVGKIFAIILDVSVLLHLDHDYYVQIKIL